MGFSTKTILIGFFLGIVLWVEGCSPSLHDAASEGNIEKLRTLIEQGADVNAKDIDDLAPLHHAAWKGDKKCVELLLAKGAAVDIRGGKESLLGIFDIFVLVPAYILAPSSNETPLHIAAQQGHLEVVKVLLDHGADINAKRSDGETPLLLAFTYLYPGEPRSEYRTPGFPEDC
jgi:ankyrin repeat protein